HRARRRNHTGNPHSPAGPPQQTAPPDVPTPHRAIPHSRDARWSRHGPNWYWPGPESPDAGAAGRCPRPRDWESQNSRSCAVRESGRVWMPCLSSRRPPCSGFMLTRSAVRAMPAPTRQPCTEVGFCRDALLGFAGRSKQMKIDIEDFRTPEDKKVHLRNWPTETRKVYRSKTHYEELLADHVDRLDKRQRLLYASNRYAVLLIFQAMDAAGKDGAIRH